MKDAHRPKFAGRTGGAMAEWIFFHTHSNMCLELEIEKNTNTPEKTNKWLPDQIDVISNSSMFYRIVGKSHKFNNISSFWGRRAYHFQRTNYFQPKLK